MQAHAVVYDAIKATHRGSQVQVGLVHNVAWIEPKEDNAFNTHVRLTCMVANYVQVARATKQHSGFHTCSKQATRQVMQFLKTGRFEWTVPLGQKIVYQHPTGRPGLDYIGINCVCVGSSFWFITTCTYAMHSTRVRWSAFSSHQRQSSRARSWWTLIGTS